MTPLEGALAALAAGWSVFPLKPGAKTPATAHGFLDAVTDRAAVDAWAQALPDCNWGVACGVSNLVVVDLDPRNGALEGQLDELPASFTVRTGGGGWHVYFRGQCKGRTGLMPGVDLQSSGKYVVLPGSVTDSAYTVERALPIVEAPAWLIAAAAARPEHATVESDCPADLVRDDRWLEHARAHLRNLPAAVQGDGGTPSWTAAGVLMRGWLLKRATADALLRAEWCPRCAPPWRFEAAGDEANWQHTLNSAEATFPLGWGEKRPLLRLGVHAERPADLIAGAPPAIRSAG